MFNFPCNRPTSSHYTYMPAESIQYFRCRWTNERGRSIFIIVKRNGRTKWRQPCKRAVVDWLTDNKTGATSIDGICFYFQRPCVVSLFTTWFIAREFIEIDTSCEQEGRDSERRHHQIAVWKLINVNLPTYTSESYDTINFWDLVSLGNINV